MRNIDEDFTPTNGRIPFPHRTSEKFEARRDDENVAKIPIESEIPKGLFSSEQGCSLNWLIRTDIPTVYNLSYTPDERLREGTYRPHRRPLSAVIQLSEVIHWSVLWIIFFFLDVLLMIYRICRLYQTLKKLCHVSTMVPPLQYSSNEVIPASEFLDLCYIPTSIDRYGSSGYSTALSNLEILKELQLASESDSNLLQTECNAASPQVAITQAKKTVRKVSYPSATPVTVKSVISRREYAYLKSSIWRHFRDVQFATKLTFSGLFGTIVLRSLPWQKVTSVCHVIMDWPGGREKDRKGSYDIDKFNVRLKDATMALVSRLMMFYKRQATTELAQLQALVEFTRSG